MSSANTTPIQKLFTGAQMLPMLIDGIVRWHKCCPHGLRMPHGCMFNVMHTTTQSLLLFPRMVMPTKLVTNTTPKNPPKIVTTIIKIDDWHFNSRSRAYSHWCAHYPRIKLLFPAIYCCIFNAVRNLPSHSWLNTQRGTPEASNCGTRARAKASVGTA